MDPALPSLGHCQPRLGAEAPPPSLLESGRLRRYRGVTLVELMVAVTIVAVGILAFFGSFQYIMVSLHKSRVKTLAINLAQEQVEILRNQGYFQLQVTTGPQTLGTMHGDYSYDTLNYPPQTFTMSGINFTRYSYVSYAQITNNVIQSVNSSTDDTGLKQIVVYVVWGSTVCAASNIYSLSSLLENPSVSTLNATVSGCVGSGPGAGCPHPVVNTLVNVAGNPNWFGVANSNGNYGFLVVPGTYTITASSAGYYAASVSNVNAKANQNTNLNFTLLQIATGTITGTAWFQNGPVISQIVATTQTYAMWGPLGCPVPIAAGGPGPCPNIGSQTVEYIELFNPTTSQFNIYTGGGTPPIESPSSGGEGLLINIVNNGTLTSDVMTNIGVSSYRVYISTYIAPGGYYLIANYPQFMINGQLITADAYYLGNGGTNLLPPVNWGAVQIQRPSSVCISMVGPGNVFCPAFDQVCWSGNSSTPSGSNAYCGFAATDYATYNFVGGGTNYIPMSCGFNTGAAGAGCQTSPIMGNQIVRFSSPTAASVNNFSQLQDVLGRHLPGNALDNGNAYNSRINASDFSYPTTTINATLGSWGGTLQFLTPYTTNNIHGNGNPPPTKPMPVVAGIPPYEGNTSVGTYAVQNLLEVMVTTDPYSGVGLGSTASVTNFLHQPQPYTPFQITGVTTGTWTTYLAYADALTANGCWNNCSASCLCATWGPGFPTPAYTSQVQNVTVSHNQATAIPNPNTNPASAAGPNLMLGLSQVIAFGAIGLNGQLLDVNGNPLANIPITTANMTKLTGPNGLFFDPQGTLQGTPVNQYFAFTANVNNANPEYVSVNEQPFNANPIVYLPYVAVLNGYVTTGTSPLPNVLVTPWANGSPATCGGQSTSCSGVSDDTGYFYIRNLAAGTYTLWPSTSTGQVSTPPSLSFTSAGSESAVFVGTFTITSIYGTLAGTVQGANGNPVVSGALIVASTGTITNPPSDINAAAAPAITPVFSVSSSANGTYSLSLLGPATYNVGVFIPTVDSNGSVVTCYSSYSVAVSPGITSTRNLTCP